MNFDDWIGRSFSRTDIITPRLVTHFTEAFSPHMYQNADVPLGLFWCLCPDAVPASQIGGDGHPKLGNFLPDIGYERRMWAGGALTFSGTFKVGDSVTKTTTIRDIQFKRGKSGNLCFVTIGHDYHVADDLILGSGCLGEMLSAYNGGNMVAVMDVPQNETASYGIVTPGADDGRIVEVNGLVEKPSPKDAPSNIAVVGRYIIEPGVFTHLDRQEQGAGGEIQLTDSLARQIGEVPFSGLRFSGERFDCGSKIGFLQANIAFALQRDELGQHLKSWLTERVK